MLNDLLNIPDGIAEANTIITQLDELFLAGFAGGRHQVALECISRVFAGSPLERLLSEHGAVLGRGELHERSFVALAAARVALQGAGYHILWQQARRALGRSVDLPPPTVVAQAQPVPVLEGVRHWLMELAITGFRRLDAGSVLPFLATLAQLREQPKLARLSFLLTGFADELLANLPLARAEDGRLWRWCDMWSVAMLNAVGTAAPPELQPVTGTLYPLGLELREHDQVISAVFYGLLASGATSEFVRLTRSRFKVASIRGDEIWLLCPDLAPLLSALEQGHTIELQDMPRLPTSDLVWDAARAQPGTSCRLLDVAAHALAPDAGQPAAVLPLPPLDRHPVQLAEPVVLTGYTRDGDLLQVAGGAALPLDTRWAEDRGLSDGAIDGATALFGLLRFDAGRWTFQPLSAASRTGKLTFAGQAGVKLLKKPPKNNAVMILEERASRLLRKS
jgi:hypothetical protein